MLSHGERLCVLGLARGHEQCQIARAMQVGPASVSACLIRARKKLGLPRDAAAPTIVDAYRAALEAELAALISTEVPGEPHD